MFVCTCMCCANMGCVPFSILSIQAPSNNSSNKYQCLFCAFIFEKEKKILLMVSLLLRFIFVKICLITVRGNETTCCVTALFCTVSPPPFQHSSNHPSINFALLFILSACSAFISNFNVCIAFKIAYELAVYFRYIRRNSEK